MGHLALPFALALKIKNPPGLCLGGVGFSLVQSGGLLDHAVTASLDALNDNCH